MSKRSQLDMGIEELEKELERIKDSYQDKLQMAGGIESALAILRDLKKELANKKIRKDGE